MVSLVKILAGVVLFGSLAVGCREAVYQLDEVPRPVERGIVMPQKEIGGFFAPVKEDEEGEQTYFYCVNWNNPSIFGIYSFDNLIFGKDTGIRVEATDYDVDGKIDLVEIAREDYREGFKSELISFQKDDSKISQQVFGIMDNLYEGVLLNLNGEKINFKEIYNQHKKDIDFLFSVK